MTCAIWGFPFACERVTKSNVAHKWGYLLHGPCRLGGQEDTRPKVLIRGEFHKPLDAYPNDACGRPERDQQFLNELAKELVAGLRVACELNTSHGPKAEVEDHTS